MVSSLAMENSPMTKYVHESHDTLVISGLWTTNLCTILGSRICQQFGSFYPLRTLIVDLYSIPFNIRVPSIRNGRTELDSFQHLFLFNDMASKFYKCAKFCKPLESCMDLLNEVDSVESSMSQRLTLSGPGGHFLWLLAAGIPRQAIKRKREGRRRNFRDNFYDDWVHHTSLIV